MSPKDATRKNVDKSKLEYGAHPPVWVTPFTSSSLYTTKVEHVLNFFLVQTPCKLVSARGILLTKYGWETETPSKGGYLEKNLFAIAGLERNINLFIGKSREDERTLFERSHMDSHFYESCMTNHVAFISGGNTLLDLFRTIRNAMAHFRFELLERDGKTFLAMENGLPNSSGSFEVKARLFLDIDTLVAWIDFIKTGAAKEKEERELQEMLDIKRQDELVKHALCLIGKGKISRQADLQEQCALSAAETRKLILTLKEKGLAEYSHSIRQWKVVD